MSSRLFEMIGNLLGGIVGLMFILFILAVVIGVFIFHIAMIVDCVRRDFKDRTIWLIVLIAGLFFGFGWIAAIIYYFTVKKPNVGTTHTGMTPPTQPLQR